MRGGDVLAAAGRVAQSKLRGVTDDATGAETGIACKSFLHDVSFILNGYSGDRAELNSNAASTALDEDMRECLRHRNGKMDDGDRRDSDQRTRRGRN